MNFRDGQLPPGASIHEALLALERAACEVVLVVGLSGRLLGILTDGDVRRAILSGAALAAPVDPFMQVKFTAVRPGVDRAEALDLMKARGIRQLPVVDADGRLIGLHLLREVLGGARRPNWAVIMAGGRGERLRPITDSLPKPMIQVAGRPILERLVLQLVGSGVSRIFLSINYKAEMIEGYFGDGSELGCRIEYLREERPMGTAGALTLLPEVPGDPVVVLNGDVLMRFDLEGMLRHMEEHAFSAVMGIHSYGHTVPFGVVETDAGRVTGLVEKPTSVWTVNAGVYAISPEVIRALPREVPCSMTDVLGECIGRGEKVGAFQIESEWLDIGRRQDLLRAKGLDEPR